MDGDAVNSRIFVTEHGHYKDTGSRVTQYRVNMYIHTNNVKKSLFLIVIFTSRYIICNVYG